LGHWKVENGKLKIGREEKRKALPQRAQRSTEFAEKNNPRAQPGMAVPQGAAGMFAARFILRSP
jgi:hypothetical protein